MLHEPRHTDPLIALRHDAERALAGADPPAPASGDASSPPLQYELQVHQIELEMQNAQLLESRRSMEELLSRYVELYDFAPVGYLTLDRHGTITMLNIASASLLGGPRAELQGRRLAVYLARESRRAFDAYLTELFGGSDVHDCELFIARDERDPLPVSLQGTRAHDGSECRVIMLDASDHHEVERMTHAARQAAEEHRQLGIAQASLDGLPEPVCVLDASGAILIDNAAWRACATALGLTASERGTGARYVDVWMRTMLPDLDVAERVELELSDLLHGRRVNASVEFAARAQDGLRWFLWNARRLGGDGPARVVVSHADITSSKQAEEERVQLSRVVEESLNELYLFDVDTLRLQYANAGARRNLGYSLDALREMTLLDIAPAPREPAIRATLASLLRGERSRTTFDSEMRRADGSEYPVTVSVQLVDELNRTVGLACALDITDRRRAEATEAGLAEQLRVSQKMESLGVLAGGIAHDFNNLIGSIRGNALLAQQAAGDLSTIVESLQDIDRAGSRAADLVQQILAFSRRKPTALQPISLGDVVRETEGLLRASMPAGVQFELEIDPDTPPILGDPAQLHQVLVNLCTNAWLAVAPHPGGIGKVQIRVQPVVVPPSGDERFGGAELQPGFYARLSVSDDGVGMSDATAARVFEPFFTTRAPGTGTGLGLSVAHGIVTAHGGVITLHTLEAEGAVFAVYFPAATVAPTERPIAGVARAVSDADADDPSATGTLTEPAQLLLIDDDPMLLAVMTRLLQRGGYRVSGRSDPGEAVAAFAATPDAFDAIVTDFNMPQLSGLDVARAVRAVRSNIPIIMASGFLTAEIREKAEALGVGQMVNKSDIGHDLAPAVMASLAASHRAGSTSRLPHDSAESVS